MCECKIESEKYYAKREHKPKLNNNLVMQWYVKFQLRYFYFTTAVIFTLPEECRRKY